MEKYDKAEFTSLYQKFTQSAEKLEETERLNANAPEVVKLEQLLQTHDFKITAVLLHPLNQ